MTRSVWNGRVRSSQRWVVAQDWVERVIEDRGLYQPIAAIKEFALDRYGEITEEELSYWEWAVGMGWYQS